MLQSSSSCPNPGYSHIVHSLDGFTTLAPQLNYITDIVLELKEELAKIKAKVKALSISSNSLFLSQRDKT